MVLYLICVVLSGNRGTLICVLVSLPIVWPMSDCLFLRSENFCFVLQILKLTVTVHSCRSMEVSNDFVNLTYTCCYQSLSFMECIVFRNRNCTVIARWRNSYEGTCPFYKKSLDPPSGALELLAKLLCEL